MPSIFSKIQECVSKKKTFQKTWIMFVVAGTGAGMAFNLALGASFFHIEGIMGGVVSGILIYLFT